MESRAVVMLKEANENEKVLWILIADDEKDLRSINPTLEKVLHLIWYLLI